MLSPQNLSSWFRFHYRLASCSKNILRYGPLEDVNDPTIEPEAVISISPFKVRSTLIEKIMRISCIYVPARAKHEEVAAVWRFR
jgi:hypothetical protein